MAHKRKDTLVPPPERWKHLRDQKRDVNKAERRAAKQAMLEDELAPDDEHIFNIDDCGGW